MRKFIKYTDMLSEDKFFKTSVDYSTVFDNIPEETKQDIEELTEYYFKNIYPDIDKISVVNQMLFNIDFEDLPLVFKLYFTRDYKSILDISSNYIKIGCSVWLDSSIDYINNNDYPLQNIYVSYNINQGEDTFKDCIYSALFYTYIIKQDFKYNSLFTYLCHEEDMTELLKIKELHIKLFGVDTECCVCAEKTQTKTVCNHTICQKCYIKLEKKTCPICRKKLAETQPRMQIVIS